MLVNNFVTNTVAFLNVFASSCEEKLSGVAQRLSGVELALALLEAKLDSVPGIAEVTAASLATTTDGFAPAPAAEEICALVSAEPAPSSSSSRADDRFDDDDDGDGGDDDEPTAEEEEPAAAPAPDPNAGMIKLREHPDYEPYFRLQKLGVPEPQIRLKMSAEGAFPPRLFSLL